MKKMKHPLSLLFCLSLIICFIGIIPVKAATNAVTPTSYLAEGYTDFIVESGNYNWNLPSNSKARGSAVSIASSSTTAVPGDVFQFIHVSGENYRILNKSSGYYLGVSESKFQAGTNIVFWDSNNADDQLYTVEQYTDGTYTIKSKGGFYIAPKGGTMKKGNILVLSANPYYWDLILAVDEFETLIPTDYSIESGSYNWTLPSTSKARGLAVSMASSGAVAAPGDVFQFIHVSGENYRIINKSSGYHLGVSEGKFQTGTNIVFWDSNNAADQLYTVEEYTDGTYTIKSKGGFYVAPKGNTLKSGNILVLSSTPYYWNLVMTIDEN